ncbi:hypothetical protein LTS08_001667 [Lithohypha guttulata]|uniref:protein-tyrosine-phosphatase n=1 Tax=Lithohypha guttulata TaxID=1690604 RepID=A0AAN7SUU9_9EURO|nr:hypothetical protein LTR51_003649 [Lithohypha guttulata]KAK5082154.1 hypothetical protein LTR05_007297 [Lithohypha guttulata]KAK5105390.1 hypothetical protein LTS08_001667 [Lithohypha guttulata]
MKYINIGVFESSCFSAIERQTPHIPSEIIPGLYLGNALTAAAYLLGKIGRPDDKYPSIARMITVLPESYEGFPFPRFPRPLGRGKDIQRLVIEKQDLEDTNLLEGFDKAAQFIEEGVLEYERAMEREEPRPASRKSTGESLDDDKGKARASSPSTCPPVSACKVRTEQLPIRPRDNPLWASKLAPKSPIVVLKQPHHPVHSNLSKPINTTQTNQQMSSSHTRAQVSQTSRNQTGAVPVHCHGGISRSATIIVAYLLNYHTRLPKSDPYDADDDPKSRRKAKRSQEDSLDVSVRATQFVRSKRSTVLPNKGFRYQLSHYASTFGRSLTDPETGKVKDAESERAVTRALR